MLTYEIVAKLKRFSFKHNKAGTTIAAPVYYD